MTLGEISAVRVFVEHAQLVNYLLGKKPRKWTQENLATNDAAELDNLQKRQDQVAAVRQTGTAVHENRETFALSRDLQYGRRRRKWLFTRGAASRMDAQYEQWLAYARLNVDQDLKAIATGSPDRLAEKRFEDFAA